MKYLTLLITLFCLGITATAQYSGGGGQGFVGKTAPGLGLSAYSMYAGGTNDGLSTITILALSLAAPSQYNGGFNDGNSSILAVNKALSSTSLYSGGSNDGSDLVTATSISFATPSMFNGGADDGFNLINKTALPLNATSNYAGGADDGSTALLVSAVALVATSMNSGGPNDGVGSVSTSLMSLTQPSSMYTGGGNDGYSTASMNISLVALSIVWEDFSVRYNRADALLEWNVGNERQDDGFEIQRSYDGYNFSQIGFVKSKTSFGVTNTYQYTDPNPAQHCSNGNCSNVYYRLRQIDLSGKFSYSPIKRLSLNYNAVTASVYPNPASDKIIVQLNAGHNAMAGYYIALRNSIGATVYKSEMLMMPLHELDVRSYASGTYYLQLFIDGRSYPYQITITH